MCYSYDGSKFPAGDEFAAISTSDPHFRGEIILYSPLFSEIMTYGMMIIGENQLPEGLVEKG